MRNLKYFITEAAKSIFSNTFMSLASITTVVFSLLLVCGFLLFTINLNYIGEQVQAQCEIVAYINLKYTDAQVKGIHLTVSKMDNVKSAELVTKYQAFEQFKKTFADVADALTGIENEEFLRNSLIITLNDISKVDETAQLIGQVDGVENIYDRKAVMDKVRKATDFINLFGIYSMILFTVIAIFLISNTIKLTVHARQREIHIMKYVGATDWFIRWPFIIEGLVVGLSGAALTYVLISLGYSSVVVATSDFFAETLKLKEYATVNYLVFGSLISFGTIMGISGSAIAIRRYLRV